MATAFIFTVLADANTFSAAMDVRLGYPKDGIDLGAGIHASKIESRTQRHGDVIPHPTLTLWRYPNDAPVQAEIGKGLVVPITATAQTLDATWFPVVALPP